MIRTLRERFPSHAILGLGSNADPHVVSRALFVGADGFVDKNIELEEFLAALKSAGDEEMVIAGPAAASVGKIAEGIERRRSVGPRLTRREREVLAVAAEGLTAREIAERLGVRERTVTTHLARIYGKLGVGNRLAALRMAARSGLVSIGPGRIAQRRTNTDPAGPSASRRPIWIFAQLSARTASGGRITPVISCSSRIASHPSPAMIAVS